MQLVLKTALGLGSMDPPIMGEFGTTFVPRKSQNSSSFTEHNSALSLQNYNTSTDTNNSSHVHGMGPVGALFP